MIDWPAPTKVKELRSFFELPNYYHRFIKGYSKIVSPLTDLLKKDRAWDWDIECRMDFESLKKAISKEPMLQFPNLDLPFEVQTDASNKALGGVLVQEGHPVAFESRKLNGAEQRYSTHEKRDDNSGALSATMEALPPWWDFKSGDGQCGKHLLQDTEEVECKPGLLARVPSRIQL